MKWGEILKKSWEHVKKHHVLWYLGILAALTEGGLGGYSGGSSSSGDNSLFNKQGDLEKIGSTASSWLSSHTSEVAIIVAALFLIGIVILYISYSARAGLIYSIDEIETSEKKINFHQAFHAGQKYFWRFLGLTVLVAIIVMVAAFLLVGLTITLFVLSFGLSLWFLILAIPVGLLALLGIIALSVYLNLTMYLAYREIVCKDKKILASISGARDLIHHNFVNIILAWLIQAAINAVVAVALLVVGAIVFGILIAIGVGLYFAGGSVIAWIYAATLLLVLILASLVVSGGINAFISTFWTLVYKKLVNK